MLYESSLFFGIFHFYAEKSFMEKAVSDFIT